VCPSCKNRCTGKASGFAFIGTISFFGVFHDGMSNSSQFVFYVFKGFLAEIKEVKDTVLHVNIQDAYVKDAI
jgi:hypothetical protein